MCKIETYHNWLIYLVYTFVLEIVSIFIATTTPLPRLDFDAQLFAGKITQTSALISWKTFTDEEMKYIDGIQVKYKAADKEVI